jgi:hypothetical protein
VTIPINEARHPGPPSTVGEVCEQTFEGVVRLDTNGFGLDDHNVSVVQDISGNVPVGEQYNIFTFDDVWGVVYNSIGGTPEAFYTTPFGDLDFPYLVCRGGRPDVFRAGGPMAGGAVVMRVRVDALPHAVQCDTRHMTTGHTGQKGGSS